MLNRCTLGYCQILKPLLKKAIHCLFKTFDSLFRSIQLQSVYYFKMTINKRFRSLPETKWNCLLKCNSNHLADDISIWFLFPISIYAVRTAVACA